MVLAELEIFHSRAVQPTRRVALGHLVLPVDPAPGLGESFSAPWLPSTPDGSTATISSISDVSSQRWNTVTECPSPAFGTAIRWIATVSHAADHHGRRRGWHLLRIRCWRAPMSLRCSALSTPSSASVSRPDAPSGRCSPEPHAGGGRSGRPSSPTWRERDRPSCDPSRILGVGR